MNQCKSLLYILILSYFFISCVQNTSTPHYAWWYELSVNLDKSDLNGHKVSDFNKEWEYASFLSEASFARSLTNDEILELKASHMVFHLQTDISGDSIFEDIYVGVYQKGNGKLGKLLAIFNGGKLKKYFTDPRGSGFSGLLIDENNTVRWYKCMQCGDYDSVNWFDADFYLE